MRILADENIPRDAVSKLRGEGYDVAWIGEIAPGSLDRAVIERARLENRLIISFDRDFGELLFQERLPPPVGVLYLRFTPRSPGQIADMVLRILRDPQVVLEGHLSVLRTDFLRQRPLS